MPEGAWLGSALELAADPKATLSEFVVSAGLEAFEGLIKEEVEPLAGPKGKKRPERTASYERTLEVATGGVKTAGTSKNAVTRRPLRADLKRTHMRYDSNMTEAAARLRESLMTLPEADRAWYCRRVRS